MSELNKYAHLESFKNVFLFFKRRIKGFITFTYPAKIAYINLHWRSKNTTHFSGKVCYKILNDRGSVLNIFCDKSKVRPYVESRIGKKYLPELYWEGTTLQDKYLQNLPNEFVIKPTHSSGGTVIVSNKCSSNQALPSFPYFSEWRSYAIHPKNVNPIHLRRLADYWLRHNFYNSPGKLPEWGYQNVVPQILIEECLLSPNNELPDDYKFFMFNGRCELIYKYSGRFGNPTIDLFDFEWTPIKGNYLLPNSKGEIPQPRTLHEMINIAEILAKDIDFVRVDLYDTNHGVKFGEMTSYPMSGLQKFKPKALNISVSSSWEI